MKKRIRLFTDIAMTVLLPMLMAYSLIGERIHEIIGSVMIVLFILHHVLNRRWYGSILRGKYTVRRTMQTVLDFLLLVFMILQPVSGILMSKHLYTFINISGVSAQAREIHLFLAYWGFVLMCIHAGTHLQTPFLRLHRKNKTVFALAVFVAAAVSIYGAIAFRKRQLAEYMFRRSSFVFFDFGEPRIWFFLDYMTIMILFASLGCIFVTLLSRRKAGKDTSRTSRGTSDRETVSETKWR